MNRSRGVLCGLAVFTLVLACVGGAPAAETPRVYGVRTQAVGDVTYFYLRIEPPRAMRPPEFPDYLVGTEAQKRNFARLPVLVPQDDTTAHVYQLLVVSDSALGMLRTPGTPLKFVGKLRRPGKARFVFRYPVEKRVLIPAKGKVGTRSLLRPGWETTPLIVDFAAAEKVPAPRKNRKRVPGQRLLHRDLEGLWATAQATRFAVLEAQAPDFGFLSFARATTGRKYGVESPALVKRGDDPRPADHQRLYELTTGAAAVAETLQRERLLSSDLGDRQPRSIHIARLPGITIAEHPWKKMMAGKKPAPEPLARLVPDDNYYLHFKDVGKFVEFLDLLDQWGDDLVRAYDVSSRAYDVRNRYEKQMCFRTSILARAFGSLLVRSLAVTGNDPYLREGSDLTLIVRVVNRDLFLAGVEPYLNVARKKFGKQLRATKTKYHNITIESFVAPLREVSLHRASFKDYLVYSNSLVGLKRVIDTYQGRHKALADALDFQYMRTVFQLEDKSEDGFGYLSDAFIRNLVGPATRIKQKRRLEALTSLHLTTNAALFAAWENGKLPADHKALLATSGLRQKEIYAPDGKGVFWDAARTTAVSDVYNTLRFATPLIELPIDLITPSEDRDYRAFHAGYLQNWRQYFDPIGTRFALSDKEVRVETYLLPLINNSEYNRLRLTVGGGTTRLDLGAAPSKTVVQFCSHISPGLRKWLSDENKMWLGDWFVIRLGDSPLYTRLGELLIQLELNPEQNARVRTEIERLFYQLPVTAGIKISDPKTFRKVLATLQRAADAWLEPCKREVLKPAYKGVVITRVQFGDMVEEERVWLTDITPVGHLLAPVLYHARIEDGWYISFSEAALKKLIDHTVARHKGKGSTVKNTGISINSSLQASPAYAPRAFTFLRSYLEWESHRRALVNVPVWYTLFHGRLVSPTMTEKKKLATAMHYLGYFPVSLENAAYRFDPRTDEVENARHGSYRRPQLHSTLDRNSSVGRLLEQFRSLRADLRFREDGIHTVLTLERK